MPGLFRNALEVGHNREQVFDEVLEGLCADPSAGFQDRSTYLRELGLLGGLDLRFLASFHKSLILGYVQALKGRFQVCSVVNKLYLRRQLNERTQLHTRKIRSR